MTFQIAAVKYDIKEKITTETFNEYITPSGKISESASAVNGLYVHKKALCRKDRSTGVLEPLLTKPCSVALLSFVTWLLGIADGDNTIDQREAVNQVILAGYNNRSFDDHIFLHHCRQYLDPDLFCLIRRKIFTADVKSVLHNKGKLSQLFVQCGGNIELVSSLHDALNDCKALSTIVGVKGLTLETFVQASVSLDYLQSRRTNPLLKANLITETVAKLMPEQMTCEAYLQMKDDELIEYLRKIGCKPNMIKCCLQKRQRFKKG